MAYTSTTAQNYEQLSYRAAALSQHRAAAREIVRCGSATTLTANQSGALVLMDAAAGFTITLPAPVQGMYFEFLQSIDQASGTQKVITDASTTYLLGYLSLVSQSAATAEAFTFNGTSHIAYTSNATTTGGYAGSRFRVTAVSSSIWLIEGVVVGSGTLATPASTT